MSTRVAFTCLMRTWLPIGVVILALMAGVCPATDQGFLGKPLNRWIAELGSKDSRVRRNAAYALGKSGAQAVAAVPRLIKKLKDPEAAVREAVAQALGEIGLLGGEEMIPALTEALASDNSAAVRRNAAIALGT